MSTPKAPPCDIPCPAKQALPWQHITSRAAHYRRCAAAPQLHKAPQLGPPNLNLCVAGQAGAAKGSAAGAAPRMPFLYPIGLRIANADPSRAAPELNEAPELHPPNLELCVAGQAGLPKVSLVPLLPNCRSPSRYRAYCGAPPSARLSGRPNWKKSLRARAMRRWCQAHICAFGCTAPLLSGPLASDCQHGRHTDSFSTWRERHTMLHICAFGCTAPLL